MTDRLIKCREKANLIETQYVLSGRQRSEGCDIDIVQTSTTSIPAATTARTDSLLEKICLGEAPPELLEEVPEEPEEPDEPLDEPPEEEPDEPPDELPDEPLENRQTSRSNHWSRPTSHQTCLIRWYQIPSCRCRYQIHSKSHPTRHLRNCWKSSMRAARPSAVIRDSFTILALNSPCSH